MISSPSLHDLAVDARSRVPDPPPWDAVADALSANEGETVGGS